MPKPPPRLTSGGACAGLLGKFGGQRDRGASAASIKRVGVKRLAAGEDVKPAPVGPGFDHARE